MAKREISSTLRNLKFMQRATHREERVTRSKEEHKSTPIQSYFAPGVDRKCVVIMEGDPIPGAVIGRMSFGSFNPSVDKLNEAVAGATDLQHPSISDVDASSHNDQNGGGHSSSRDMSPIGTECSNSAGRMKFEANEDHLKRKQPETVLVVSMEHNQKSKLPKTVQGGQHCPSGSSSRSSFKKPKSEKLDWSVLRPKDKRK